MLSARELANQVVAARQISWDKADSAVAVVATDTLNPDDEAVVRRFVAAEGYSGAEFDQMSSKVSRLVVGTVEALADDQPATGAD